MKKYTLLVLAMSLNVGLFGASNKTKLAAATRTFNTSTLCYNPDQYQYDELEEKKLIGTLQEAFETVQRLEPARCRKLTQHPAFRDFIHKLQISGKDSMLQSLAHIIPENNIDLPEKVSVDVSARDEEDDFAAAIAASLASSQLPTIIEASSLTDDDNTETFRFIPLSVLAKAEDPSNVKWWSFDD